MGQKFLIDTNATIEFLGKKLPESGELWLSAIAAKQAHSVSVINRIELLSKNEGLDEVSKVESFLSATNVLPLDESVTIRTIALRQQARMKLPDAIIAATALVYGLTLVTRNVKDFEKVPGLTLVNPHDII